MQNTTLDAALLQNNGEDISAALAEIISSTPDNTVLTLPTGRYFIGHDVHVTGKKNLTLRGNNTTLYTHFTTCDDPAENNHAFVCSHCEGLTFENLVFSTDNPVNCSGRVTSVDNVHHTYDVRIADEFPVTGWEHFWGTDTCDEDGMPDYVIETYDEIIREEVTDENGSTRVKFTGTKYEKLDGQNIRVFMPSSFDLSRLTVGHRVLYRYLIYGSHIFWLSDCDDTVFRDIEVERATSVPVLITPRCHNATFERFNVRIPQGSEALYSANADGIHITGLSGTLTMKDCHFDGLGDDALNIHSQAGEIAETDGEKMHFIYRDRSLRSCPLGEKWAQGGDLIRFYDRNTFLEKGTFRIVSYDGGDAVVTEVSGNPAVGDILANDSFFASVDISDCSVRNTRARGFLLQSRNMHIKNCSFSGMSLPGIIISPDIRVWYEVGPSDNTEITGCTFEKCAMNGSAANLGAIVVKAAHDSGAADYPAGVHTNLKITDSSFKDIGSSGIFVSAAKGVTVTGNRFYDCKENKNPSVEDTDCDIVLCNCDNIRISGNKTERGIVVKSSK